MQPVIEMKGITKRFPGVLANDRVNFSLQPGEIHALLGENGAGKTTLMKILYGLYNADAGDIFVNEKKVRITSPEEAIKLGIGMVHQHFMLVEPFSVTENIVLGSEPRRGAFIDYVQAVEDVKRISDRYGLYVDPYAKIRDISVGMQQRVEILKALYRGADILILDEPTAVLTPQEVEELYEIMKSLVKEGKSIIFITHKLKEVKAICDRTTVIRRGKVIDTVNTGEVEEEDLARMMVGREVVLRVSKGPAKPGEKILELKNIQAKNDRGLPALRGISFAVRKGEILGIAGVEGNGQSELTEVLTGLRRVEQGEIIFKGKDLKDCSTREILRSGIAYIPEDRQKRGLILDFSLMENFILGSHYFEPFADGLKLNFPKIKAFGDKLLKEYDVRAPGTQITADSLSGGNQQKAILAREFARDPDLLIAAQPTRGLDVGAIEFIHKRLIELRDQGKAIILVSLELDEILSLSDRILVIYEGRIVAEMDIADATEKKLGLYMAGGQEAVKQERGVS